METITTSIRTETQLKRDVPNAETLAAMREADRIASDPEAGGFTSVEELFADLDA